MQRFAVSLAAAVLIAMAGPAGAFLPVIGCSQIEDRARQIRECTRMIESGAFPRSDIVTAYHNRAYAYLEVGEIDKARVDFDAGLKMAPNDGDMLYGRGLALYEGGDLERSLADFNALLQSDPSDAEALYYRASLLDELGRLDRAVVDYSHLLEIAPESAELYNSRAWARYRLGENEAALTDVERALALVPQDPHSLDTRAHILAANGRPEDALADFRAAIEFGGPDFVQMYQEALLKHGHYQGAADGIYQTALLDGLIMCLTEDCRVVE